MFKKLMPGLKICFFVLYVTAIISGVVLCYGPRSQRGSQQLQEDLKKILPHFDNKPWEETFNVDGFQVFPARAERKVQFEGSAESVTANALSGFAVKAPKYRDSEGLNPLIAGFDLEGNITGMRNVFHRPGLVPENEISSETRFKAKLFFEHRRSVMLEKANEGAMA